MRSYRHVASTASDSVASHWSIGLWGLTIFIPQSHFCTHRFAYIIFPANIHMMVKGRNKRRTKYLPSGPPTKVIGSLTFGSPTRRSSSYSRSFPPLAAALSLLFHVTHFCSRCSACNPFTAYRRTPTSQSSFLMFKTFESLHDFTDLHMTSINNGRHLECVCKVSDDTVKQFWTMDVAVYITLSLLLLGDLRRT